MKKIMTEEEENIFFYYFAILNGLAFCFGYAFCIPKPKSFEIVAYPLVDAINDKDNLLKSITDNFSLNKIDIHSNLEEEEMYYLTRLGINIKLIMKK